MTTEIIVAAVIGLRVENTNGIVREGAGNARVLVNVVQGNLSEPVTIRLISVNLNAKSEFILYQRCSCVLFVAIVPFNYDVFCRWRRLCGNQQNYSYS